MSQRSMTKRKSGTTVAKQAGLKQGTLRTVNAGGVPVPVPQKRENLVKVGLIGGGVVMAGLAFTPVGPLTILCAGAAALFVGGAIGNAMDEEKNRR